VDEPLRFVRKGPSTYHVFSGDVQLGWLDDRTIALLGYDTAADARCAGTTAYAAVGWTPVAPGDGRSGARWRDPNAVAPEHRIEVEREVVGRVVGIPDRRSGCERYGFELARARGQTFAASVHQFHRVLSTAPTSRATPGWTPLTSARGHGA
jgi:hypothetical protein